VETIRQTRAVLQFGEHGLWMLLSLFCICECLCKHSKHLLLWAQIKRFSATEHTIRLYCAHLRADDVLSHYVCSAVRSATEHTIRLYCAHLRADDVLRHYMCSAVRSATEHTIRLYCAHLLADDVLRHYMCSAVRKLNIKTIQRTYRKVVGSFPDVIAVSN
jgi:hypothetical protein